MNLVVSSLLLLFAFVVSASAQTVPDIWARVGLFGGIGVNIHSAPFRQLEGVPSCCPESYAGSGLGAMGGLLYEKSILRMLELGLRVGYEGRGATLEAFETKPVIHEGDYIDGRIRHVIETAQPQVFIEPHAAVRLGTVRLQAGPRFAIPAESTFEQREELVEPADIGTFENLRRVRNDTSGLIPGMRTLDLGLSFGASIDIPLNAARTLTASPEVVYTLDLNDVTTNREWRTHALRFGVAIRHALVQGQVLATNAKPVETVPARLDSIGVPKVGVRALAVDRDGSERPDVTVSVEEFISTNMRPLLNYVFFDEGSSTLASRYRRVDPRDFDVSRLHGLDAIGTYHHLLNIIGQGLRSSPRARVTLVGCTAASGADAGVELARARAATVRQYLVSTWGIDSSRIAITARGLPIEASDTSTADGRAENRRVEIVVDDPNVLAPVVTADTLRSVTPPLLRFRPQLIAGGPLSQWTIEVRQRERSIRTFDGTGTPPVSIDWNTNEDQLAIPVINDSLRYVLRAVDARGATAIAEGSLAVNVVTLRRKQEERVGDRIIDRYSLILFDFDQAALDETNARIGTDIRARIASGAQTTVTGHTDRIGDDAYNARLSHERARNVARLLGVPLERATGRGESDLLYDNELPEGRFYSRTVSIVVETPVPTE